MGFQIKRGIFIVPRLPSLQAIGLQFHHIPLPPGVQEIRIERLILFNGFLNRKLLRQLPVSRSGDPLRSRSSPGGFETRYSLDIAPAGQRFP